MIVDTSFTVAGDVASFDAPAFRSALLAKFTDAVDVRLAVSAASVRVNATIVMPSIAAANVAADAIRTTPMATMQAEWFGSGEGGGFQLEAAPVVESVASEEVDAVAGMRVPRLAISVTHCLAHSQTVSPAP